MSVEKFEQLIEKKAERLTYTDAISILKNTKKSLITQLVGSIYQLSMSVF